MGTCRQKASTCVSGQTHATIAMIISLTSVVEFVDKSSEKGEKEEAVKVLDSISQKFPKTLTIKRLLLDLSTGNLSPIYSTNSPSCLS